MAAWRRAVEALAVVVAPAPEAFVVLLLAVQLVVAPLASVAAAQVAVVGGSPVGVVEASVAAVAVPPVAAEPL
jgi:hypothetical protein